MLPLCSTVFHKNLGRQLFRAISRSSLSCARHQFLSLCTHFLIPSKRTQEWVRLRQGSAARLRACFLELAICLLTGGPCAHGARRARHSARACFLSRCLREGGRDHRHRVVRATRARRTQRSSSHPVLPCLSHPHPLPFCTYVPIRPSSSLVRRVKCGMYLGVSCHEGSGFCLGVPVPTSGDPLPLGSCLCTSHLLTTVLSSNCPVRGCCAFLCLLVFSVSRRRYDGHQVLCEEWYPRCEDRDQYSCWDIAGRSSSHCSLGRL